MHSLEVIIKRNAEAAGRELAHQVNDGKPVTIVDESAGVFALLKAFFHGYNKGREEG